MLRILLMALFSLLSLYSPRAVEAQTQFGLAVKGDQELNGMKLVNFIESHGPDDLSVILFKDTSNCKTVGSHFLAAAQQKFPKIRVLCNETIFTSSASISAAVFVNDLDGVYFHESRYVKAGEIIKGINDLLNSGRSPNLTKENKSDFLRLAQITRQNSLLRARQAWRAAGSVVWPGRSLEQSCHQAFTLATYEKWIEGRGFRSENAEAIFAYQSFIRDEIVKPANEAGIAGDSTTCYGMADALADAFGPLPKERNDIYRKAAAAFEADVGRDPDFTLSLFERKHQIYARRTFDRINSTNYAGILMNEARGASWSYSDASAYEELVSANEKAVSFMMRNSPKECTLYSTQIYRGVIPIANVGGSEICSFSTEVGLSIFVSQLDTKGYRDTELASACNQELAGPACQCLISSYDRFMDRQMIDAVIKSPKAYARYLQDLQDNEFKLKDVFANPTSVIGKALSKNGSLIERNNPIRAMLRGC